MTRFVANAIVLAVVPMSTLNPIRRSAFLGYYLGVVTMWLAFVITNAELIREEMWFFATLRHATRRR
jgi:hypothetical protein